MGYQREHRDYERIAMSEHTAWRVTAENAEKDAARYRWLRSKPIDWSVEKHTNGWATSFPSKEMDAAIDAAMKDES